MREGELLAGKYRIERVLGVGGMGIVVAARHEQLDQRVAIKFVRSDALANADAVERFLREARAAAKLRSEHAAKVLDVGTLEAGVPYMVMELLEGSDLAQVLEDRGPLPVELAVDWMVQACEAVAEAHASGIVHRDLKPQNLFLALTVGGGAKVKVLDFGVAKSMTPSTGVLGALTRTRATLGSPLYMAPEQMRSSRDVDARADVWALGVVLFELLTQRCPFEAEAMPELCLKVVTDPPQSLAGFRPDVPGQLVRVVERCLEKDPARRFANAAELALALEPFASQESRAVVARAQMVMANASPRRASEKVGSLGTRAEERSSGRPAEPRGRAVGTPAAWGSGRVAASPPQSGRTKKSRALWIGLIAATLAVAGGAVAVVALVIHSAQTGRTSPTPSADSRPPLSAAIPLSSTPTADGVTAPETRLDPPVGPLPPAPTPTQATAPPIATAASEERSTSAAVAGGAAPSSAATSAKPAPVPAGTRQPPVGKPTGRDDDIPSLR